MPCENVFSVNDLNKISFEFSKEQPDLRAIGEMTHEGRWNRIVNGACGWSQPRLTLLVNKINQALGLLEQRGIKSFSDEIDDPAFQEEAQRYRASFDIYLNVVNQISEHLETLDTLSPELEKAYHELGCRTAGLLYSLGEENGGIDPLDVPDQEVLSALIEHASDWKKKQKLAIDPSLNDLDRKQLESMACYPEWAKLVMEDRVAVGEAFNWSLRDFNSVEVMVKCYSTRRKLKAAVLSPYIGYSRNPERTEPEFQVLSFQTVPTKVEGVSKKILTASIYHGSFNAFEPDKQERVNILKPTQQIHFEQGNYTLTVEEFLKECAQKNSREVNINLCADWGFINYQPVKGIWNADNQAHESIEVTQENWMTHLPAMKIETHDKLVEQYGEKIEGKNFFFKIMATRQEVNLNALNCHAFWQFYHRMEDGNWKVLNLGFYPHRFQQGGLDGLRFFAASVDRVLSLMDQNAVFTHRQRGAFPIFPSEEQQEKLIARIHEWMVAQGVFQFVGRNCAYTVQNGTGKIVDEQPNFFRLPLTHCRTGINFLDRLLVLTRRQPKWVQWLVVTILHRLLFSHRELVIEKENGKVHYSVKDYMAKGHEIYNPAFMIHQIAKAQETGAMPFAEGELYWSHTDEWKKTEEEGD